MHARKLKHLEARFEWYSDAFEPDPSTCKGHWAQKHFADSKAVYLDLGCGKGAFTVESALANPDVFYIGFDYEEQCIALCAQKAVEAGAKNVVFAIADADYIADYFDEGELSLIFLNFSSPYPRSKHAWKRLTYANRLAQYRKLLKPDGVIWMKTDSPPLFEWSLNQFRIAGYSVVWKTADLRAEKDVGLLAPMTGYEDRLIEKGAKIHALKAMLGEEPSELIQDCSPRLLDYLPEDLSTLDYVPYGMEDTVFNESNRRRHVAERVERAQAADGEEACDSVQPAAAQSETPATQPAPAAPAFDSATFTPIPTRFHITGDVHGDFRRVKRYVRENQLGENDVVVVLGDAGVNYFGNHRDIQQKKLIAKLPVTVFCIHGNHEMRPQTIHEYHEAQFLGGTVFVEDEYPNLLFAKDGELFDFCGTSVFVCGGAYTLDKEKRLEKGWSWFADEQPDNQTKALVEKRLAELDWSIDVMFTHTCPLKYEPVEAFFDFIDQSIVDKSTEEWLESIENRLDYKRWYCGHYHCCKAVDKLHIMYEDWEIL